MHPRTGGKELSDAINGSIYNAVIYTPKPQNEIVEVMTLKDIYKNQEVKQEPKFPIRAPKREAPPELHEYLARIKML